MMFNASWELKIEYQWKRETQGVGQWKLKSISKVLDTVIDF